MIRIHAGTTNFSDEVALDRDTVESLVRGLRAAECFDLPMSSLDTAVSLLREVMLR